MVSESSLRGHWSNAEGSFLDNSQNGQWWENEASVKRFYATVKWVNKGNLYSLSNYVKYQASFSALYITRHNNMQYKSQMGMESEM